MSGRSLAGPVVVGGGRTGSRWLPGCTEGLHGVSTNPGEPGIGLDRGLLWLALGQPAPVTGSRCAKRDNCCTYEEEH